MQNKRQNYNKGREGESLALEYLTEKGMKLIESNYENVLGEIDLIMTSGPILVFVEVKLKVGDRFGLPEEMISSGKINRIRRIAESFLVLEKEISKRFDRYRIDAVCIVKKEDGRVERISHYENIGS